MQIAVCYRGGGYQQAIAVVQPLVDPHESIVAWSCAVQHCQCTASRPCYEFLDEKFGDASIQVRPREPSDVFRNRAVYQVVAFCRVIKKGKAILDQYPWSCGQG